jgi:phosphatidate cytidylyltransferase
MAFNWQSFKTRTLTAAIFVVVMLAGLLINRWTFFILFSVIHFGCWWEYLKLTEKIFKIQIDRVIKYILMDIGYVLFWLIAYRNHQTIDFGISIGPLIISLKWMLYSLIAICLGAFLFINKKMPWKAKWLSVGGLLYISLSLGLIIDLWKEFFIAETNFQYQSSPTWHRMVVPCSIIFSLWINDTMAYIVGSLIGKTSLSKISPNKTWEGTVGGIVLTIIVVALIAWKFDFDIYQLVIIAAIASIAGTFGDLLESKLKRMAGVKDSGHIMPGHGGFLDRFDSLLVAIPFVWLYVYFFMS